MTCYLITYDNKPPRNYSELYDLMKRWSAIRLADSVWLANLRGPAAEVRDCVQGTMQFNDLVAVVELKPGSDWATLHVSNPANAWLSANIMPSQQAA